MRARSVRWTVVTVSVVLAALGLLAGSAAAQTGGIAGTVTNSGDGPLSGVTVRVLNQFGGQVAQGTTTGTGAYTIVNLPPGSYLVRTQVTAAQNFIDEIYINLPCPPCTGGSLVPVTAGNTTLSIDFSLDPGGSIAGTVVDETTLLPINNAFVQVYSGTGAFVRGAATGGTGVFSVGGLPSGAYFAKVQIGQTNYVDELYDNLQCLTCPVTSGTPINVTAGVVTSGINFSPLLGGAITGTVTDAATLNPVSGVSVQVFRPFGGIPVRNVVTNASGVFTAQGLPAGSYVARTGVPQTSSYIDEIYDGRILAGNSVTSGTPIPVTNGATTGSVNFALETGGSISGIVTNAVTLAPLSGVGVSVFNSRGEQLWTAGTNGAGAYEIGRLPAGSYFVTVDGPSDFVNELFDNFAFFEDRSVIGGTPVAVSTAAVTPNINFALSPGGSITGTVIDASTMLPIEGAEITVHDSTGREVADASTDSTGAFTVSGLPTGTYYARTEDVDGYIDEMYGGAVCPVFCRVTAGTPIAVTTGAVTSGIDFSLAAGGRIAGNVTNAVTTNPLGSVTVVIFSAAGVPVSFSETDASGNYTTRNGFPTGTYYARTANRDGYLDRIYSGLTFCAPDCHVTSGTGIAVTAGLTTNGVNFALSTGTEMIQNGDFNNGVASWVLFATPDMSFLQWEVTQSEEFAFRRQPPPPGTSNQAVIFQNTGVAVPANTSVLATFRLGNIASVPKRIAVLVQDSDFSDLAVCTFWLPARAERTPYAMRVRTTKAWTNATIAFYAASTDVPSGYYRIDDISMQAVAGPASTRVDCVDVLNPGATGDPDGPDLLGNGDFSSGTLAPWGTFGTITYQVAGGVFEFIRPSNTAPSGVILQPTGQAVPAGTIVTATFELGNSSIVRKRVTVLLHDLSFSDLAACTFWLEPGQPLSAYAARAYTTRAWTNATLSVYPATTGLHEWIRLDNVTFRTTPGTVIIGTECVEPVSPIAAGAAAGSPAGRYDVPGWLATLSSTSSRTTSHPTSPSSSMTTGIAYGRSATGRWLTRRARLRRASRRTASRPTIA
jgi:hypothetical protein